MIKPGAILTERETQDIIRRLSAISIRTGDRRLREQCRLIGCAVNRARRRVARPGADEPKIF